MAEEKRYRRFLCSYQYQHSEKEVTSVEKLIEEIYNGTTEQRLESISYLAERAREKIEKHQFEKALEIVKLMEKIAKGDDE